MAVTGALPRRDLATPRDADATPRPRDRRQPGAWLSVAVVVGYVVIGVLAFRPVLGSLSTRLSGPAKGDTILFAWFVGWIPHALSQGANPLFSHALLVPHGVDVAANTSSPLLGLLTAPLTAVAGPVVSTNVLMVAAMPLSAAAAFVVLRVWRVWLPAAALGGLVYGFSPYMVAQSIAHPELTFVPLPPFIVLVTVLVLQRRGRQRRLGVALGLLVAAQFLISPEVLASLGVLTTAGVVAAALRRPDRVAEVARAAWRPVALAVLVGGVLLAYPVWLMLAGPQHYTGTPQPLGGGYHDDLLSPIAAGPLQAVALGTRALGSRLLVGAPAETDGYLGVPLLVLLALLAWRSRRSPRMQLVVGLLLVGVLLTLGSHLSIDGRDTGVPLPFLALARLPVLADILPSRFSFEVGALLAAALAFGLDDLRRPVVSAGSPARSRQRGGSPNRLAVVGTAVVVAVVVATLLPQWPYPSQSAEPLPAAVREAVPSGDPVAITYPFVTKYRTLPEMWQAEDDYAFALLGGYALHPGTSGAATLFPGVMVPADLQRYLLHEQSSAVLGGPGPVVVPDAAASREALARNHVRLVLVDDHEPNSDNVIALFTAALGPPTVASDAVTAWVDRSGVW